MTKRTFQSEKKTFIGLVINKLANTGHKDLTSRITAKSDNLDVGYKTAQRYARTWLHVNIKDPACKEQTEQFHKVWICLESLHVKVNTLRRKGDSHYYTTGWIKRVLPRVEEIASEMYFDSTISFKRGIEDFSRYVWQDDQLNDYAKELAEELETAEIIKEYEAEAPATEIETPVKPVDNAQPVTALWDTPEAAPYLKLASWLVAIDQGQINGTITEAKKFISTIDDYTYKLQALMVKQAKDQLKNLLRQVKECEVVLDRTEVENVWLEVGTENCELVVTPYSREIASTPVHKLPNPVEAEVVPSNTVMAL